MYSWYWVMNGTGSKIETVIMVEAIGPQAERNHAVVQPQHERKLNDPRPRHFDSPPGQAYDPVRRMLGVRRRGPMASRLCSIKEAVNVSAVHYRQ